MVYSNEGIFSDFTPTTTIEGFLRKNLLSYANVSDKITQRIRKPMIEEKVIVKKGDVG